MLISDEYRKEQERLHAKGGYGVIAKKFAPLVAGLMENNQIKHILDYGCGKNNSLLAGFRKMGYKKNFKYQAYDPGVPKYSEPPVPAELVCCIDVLEHIEPELLEDVLDHLCSLTEVLTFLTVHTGPAAKTLSDGRNAHLIQKPPEWWLPKFQERWTMQTFQLTPHGFWFVGHNQDLALEEQAA